MSSVATLYPGQILARFDHRRLVRGLCMLYKVYYYLMHCCVVSCHLLLIEVCKLWWLSRLIVMSWMSGDAEKKNQDDLCLLTFEHGMVYNYLHDACLCLVLRVASRYLIYRLIAFLNFFFLFFCDVGEICDDAPVICKTIVFSHFFTCSEVRRESYCLGTTALKVDLNLIMYRRIPKM